MATATIKSSFGRARPHGGGDAGSSPGKAQEHAQGFRIAGVQMASGPNVSANLNEAGRLIETAAAQGAKLIALGQGKVFGRGHAGARQAGEGGRFAIRAHRAVGMLRPLRTFWRRPRGGYHVSGRETHGDSMVADPWGTVLDRLPRGSGVVSAWINPAYLESVRKSLPALTHRAIHKI